VQVIQYALLGLGAGAAYGLAAIGAVVIYRGSGILNFAQSAVGMVGGYTFYKLWDGGVPWPIALLIGLAVGAAIGLLFQLLVLRPMRHSPPITHLIATLGLLSLLTGLGEMIWGYYSPSVVNRLVPQRTIHITSQLSVNRDRLIILGIGVILTALCWALFRWTKFGLATSSVAESRRATAAIGLSADRIAAINWMLGSALGVLAAVLTASISTVLQVESLTLIIIPAFAAALIGSFRSFWLTLAGGLLIGAVDSEGSYLQVRFPHWPLSGWSDSVPFAIIIIIMVSRGRGLPLRGEPILKPPRIGNGEIRPVAVALGFAVAALIAWFVLSPAATAGLTQSCGIALIILSVVVITGYAGQLSLAQFAVAGAGGWAAAYMVSSGDVSSTWAWIIALVAIVPLGVVIGLPALRTRGVNLAVVTLGLASILAAQLFNDENRTGGYTGLQVGKLHLFGIDVDAISHPQRYAIVSLLIVVVAGLGVANVRRSGTGRQLLAVRSNERAAASLGISLARSKLYAFSVGAVLAALGGLVIVFATPTPEFNPQFSQFQNVEVIVLAVIGGVGFIMGSVMGGIIAPAALLAGLLIGPTSGTFISPLFKNAELGEVILGLVVFDVLRRNPDGIVAAPQPKWVLRLAARIGDLGVVRQRGAYMSRDGKLPSLEGEVAPSAAGKLSGRSLTCTDVSVRFGGVQALQKISLEVRSGEVLGVIGANGAGKTTLLDALTGFVPLETGQIHLNGERIDGWSVARRARAGIRRSFQGLELFETMTVRENLAVACDQVTTARSVRDVVMPRRERWTPAAITALTEFSLNDFIDTRPTDLSYGQRRLVAIARAAVSAPQILLLDEPAAGLDLEEREELAELIHTFASERGVGVLLIEHDVDFVMRCSDQMVALDFGEIIAKGDPGEVRSDDRVIAAYLGTSGNLAAKSTAEPDGATLSTRQEEKLSELAQVGNRSSERNEDPNAVLAVHDLAAGYGGVPIVRDVDLTVSPGEVVALLGPNGAGKSTTLLTIAGELPALGGRMDRLGTTNMRVPLHHLVRQGLGFVMEERSITSSLTTAENLRIGAGGIEEAMGYFPELRPLLNRPAGLLSGGEQRILALGRVLAAKPKLLLADELSLGLAPQVVERLLGAIRDAATRGAGVLLVEQHAEQALEIADRYLVLRRGEIVARGDARELRGNLAALASSYLD
jgi:sulfate-transporting ATPase